VGVGSGCDAGGHPPQRPTDSPVLQANNEAALDSNSTRTLQVILLGTILGELGLLSRGKQSRTIIASTDSRLAMLSRDSLDEIEETDKVRGEKRAEEER
jgi:CRP-like cAMP-binding protein